MVGEGSDEMLERGFARAYLVGTVLTTAIIPLGLLVDRLTHPLDALPLALARGLVVGLALTLFGVSRWRRWRPLVSGVGLLAIVFSGLLTMTLLTGGYRSIYFHGMYPLLVGAGLLPWGAVSTGLAVTAMDVIYIAAVLIQCHGAIERPELLVNDIWVLGSLSTVSVAVTWFAERLRREVAHRDEFLSVASHELKTPVTALKLRLDLVNRTLKSNQSLQTMVSKSTAEVERLTRLIEDLLDLSQIRNGKLRFSYETSDLSLLVHETVERFREQFAAAGARLHFQNEAELLGSWDRMRLEQALANLLANALKYAPGSDVEVALGSEGDRAVLRVRDRGPGIAKEKQDLIFGRYQRGVPPAKTSGLGLGLYLAQQIVFAHGGSIRVESEPGQGATFIVALPLDAGTTGHARA